MSVYVDDMRLLATVGNVRGRWSHMWADTLEELEDFAGRLRLNPKWLQVKSTYHYDVVDSKRLAAISMGAIPLKCRTPEWAEAVRQAMEYKRSYGK